MRPTVVAAVPEAPFLGRQDVEHLHGHLVPGEARDPSLGPHPDVLGEFRVSQPGQRFGRGRARGLPLFDQPSGVLVAIRIPESGPR